MSATIYINYNGFLYEENEKIFTIKNRGFRYGDALFETIRIINGQPCNLEDHFTRLKKGMGVLKMRSAKMSFINIEEQIIKLIEKNRIKKGGKIRLSLFRSGEGLYTPENDIISEYLPLLGIRLFCITFANSRSDFILRF